MPIEFRHPGGILGIDYERAMKGLYKVPPPVTMAEAFAHRQNARVIVDGYWDPELEMGVCHDQNLNALVRSARKHGYSGLSIAMDDFALSRFTCNLELLSTLHRAQFEVVAPKRARQRSALRILFAEPQQ